jgi:hypothetical protein
MPSENAKLYETISLLSKEQLELLFRTTTTKISEKMFRLKNANTNISTLLEDNYQLCDHLNCNFEDIEMIEYNIDEFFEKYKLIKKSIAKARLLKYKLCECNRKEDVPDDLVKIGCKKIQSYQILL